MHARFGELCSGSSLFMGFLLVGLSLARLCRRTTPSQQSTDHNEALFGRREGRGGSRKKSTRKTIGKNVEANRELRIWDVSKKLKPSCGIKPCRVRGGLIIHRPHLGQFSLELLLYEKRQRGLWIIHDTTPSLFFPYWKETRNSSSFLFFLGRGGWYVYSPSCQEWDKKIDSTLVSER